MKSRIKRRIKIIIKSFSTSLNSFLDLCVPESHFKFLKIDMVITNLKAFREPLNIQNGAATRQTGKFSRKFSFERCQKTIIYNAIFKRKRRKKRNLSKYWNTRFILLFCLLFYLLFYLLL